MRSNATCFTNHFLLCSKNIKNNYVSIKKIYRVIDKIVKKMQLKSRK